MPMRVHALARELKMSHHELLRVIESAPRDIPAETMMSQLTDDDVSYLRQGVAHGFAPRRRVAIELTPEAWLHERASRRAARRARAAHRESRPKDEAFRAALDEYRAFSTRWSTLPVPDPPDTQQLVPGFQAQYTSLSPMTRAVLARRNASLSLLHPHQQLFPTYLFGACAIDTDAPTLAALQRGDDAVLSSFRQSIPALFGCFGIDWEYHHTFTQDSVNAQTSEVRVGEPWRAEYLAMRAVGESVFAERTYEYGEKEAPRFVRWRQDPSSIDPSWVVEQEAHDLAMGACLSHEMERAEDVLLNVMRDHVVGSDLDAAVTHITLLEDDENVRYQFYVLAGPDGAALTLRSWEL